MKRLRWSAAAALLALVAVVATTAGAQETPRLPCGGEPPFPAYAALDAPPEVGLWTEKPLEQPDLAHVRLWAGASLADLPPPPCTDWTPVPFAVAVSARFRNPDGVEPLIERLAAASALRSLPHWAAARQRWEPLFEEAYAVRDPESRERRDDFSPDELRSGSDLYLYEDMSGPIGGAVYRMHVRERRPDRLEVAVENVTSARVMGLFPLRPGTFRLVYVLERLPEEGVWGYYALLGLATTPDSARNSVNRSAALFRYLVGIPPEQTPPVWP
jgi:hypothetical protein